MFLFSVPNRYNGVYNNISIHISELQSLQTSRILAKVQPLGRRDKHVENANDRRKILIGDKPQSSASHGYILILVIMCNHSLIFVYVKYNASNTEFFLNRNVL